MYNQKKIPKTKYAFMILLQNIEYIIDIKCCRHWFLLEPIFNSGGAAMQKPHLIALKHHKI